MTIVIRVEKHMEGEGSVYDYKRATDLLKEPECKIDDSLRRDSTAPAAKLSSDACRNAEADLRESCSFKEPAFCYAIAQLAETKLRPLTGASCCSAAKQ
jgi:hypothetical protein